MIEHRWTPSARLRNLASRRDVPINAAPWQTVREALEARVPLSLYRNALLRHFYFPIDSSYPDDSFQRFLSNLRKPFNVHNELFAARHVGITIYHKMREAFHDYL
jgi:hypothetical protein